MGILRTDKISGLETPTAVTGSVEFDGNGDYLIPAIILLLIGGNDFTAEGWIYADSYADWYTRLFGQIQFPAMVGHSDIDGN